MKTVKMRVTMNLKKWTQKNQEKLKERLWTILDGHV